MTHIEINYIFFSRTVSKFNKIHISAEKFHGGKKIVRIKFGKEVE